MLMEHIRGDLLALSQTLTDENSFDSKKKTFCKHRNDPS